MTIRVAIFDRSLNPYVQYLIKTVQYHIVLLTTEHNKIEQRFAKFGEINDQTW